MYKNLKVISFYKDIFRKNIFFTERGEVYSWGFGHLGRGKDNMISTTPELIPPTLFGANEFSPDVKVINLAL